MRLPLLVGTAALGLSLLAGCATTQSFSGTVATSDAVAFAPDAATVQVSLVDAAGTVVASQAYAVEGRPSVAFRFSPSPPLEAGARYALRARVISRTGAVLYQTVEAMPVTLADGGALRVRVEPTQVGG